jgi:hypothetical protein
MTKRRLTPLFAELIGSLVPVAEQVSTSSTIAPPVMTPNRAHRAALGTWRTQRRRPRRQGSVGAREKPGRVVSLRRGPLLNTLSLAGLLAVAGLSSTAEASNPDLVTAVTACMVGATGGPGADCASGTVDSAQPVLTAGTKPINTLVPEASDEHPTVLPPSEWGSSNAYLLFVATATKSSRGCCGLAALSSIGAGPAANGVWHFRFAPGYGTGRVFAPPSGFNSCPPTDDDERFDLNYAAPGSIVPNPDLPHGLLMAYEGSDKCSADSPSKGAYITDGIATSSDDGKTWPAYPANASGSPYWMGGTGRAYCPSPPLSLSSCQPLSSWGRYAVLSITPSLATAFSQDTPTPYWGEGEPSAFLDTSGSTPYLYIVHGAHNAGDGIAIARAPITKQLGQLSFYKWNGTCWGSPGSCSPGADGTPDGIGGPEHSMLTVVPKSGGTAALDAGWHDCADYNQAPATASISYEQETHQYLLLFVCSSPADPLGPFNPATTPAGAAWFWATSSSLSQPDWTTFGEITGTWSTLNDSSYAGWYPLMFSLDQPPSQLTDSGYVFYTAGCLGKSTTGTCSQHLGRTFSSRRFAIRTTLDAYAQPPVTTVQISPSNLVPTLSFSSASPGSSFSCQFGEGPFTPCHSPIRLMLKPGLTVVAHVQAIDPFGVAGPIASARYTEPYPRCRSRNCPPPRR